MIISISGKPGSGKSTIAKRLADKLSYKFYNMGKFRREMARERGITLAQLSKKGEKDFTDDKATDQRIKELSKKENNFVIDSRTAFFIIPDSLKIFFDVSLEEGARRIWGDLQKNPKKRNEAKVNSFQDLIQSIKDRFKSDKFRYKKYYNIDVYDPAHYDFVIDTTNLSIEEVFNKAWEFVNERIERLS